MNTVGLATRRGTVAIAALIALAAVIVTMLAACANPGALSARPAADTHTSTMPADPTPTDTQPASVYTDYPPDFQLRQAPPGTQPGIARAAIIARLGPIRPPEVLAAVELAYVAPSMVGEPNAGSPWPLEWVATITDATFYHSCPVAPIGASSRPCPAGPSVGTAYSFYDATTGAFDAGEDIG